jgi:hypothetical protein
MNDLIAKMTPDEIRDGLWLVGVFEDWGSMTQDEADEWWRRIVSRQQFLELDPSQPPS